MTIKKIEWDGYLEDFFNKPEAKEKWEEFCSSKSAYNGMVYPQPNKCLSIYKKEGTEVYFIKLMHFHLLLTRYLFSYVMLYKKQYVIFGSVNENSKDCTLNIKIIPKELEKDISEIKTLVRELFPVLNKIYESADFILVDQNSEA